MQLEIIARHFTLGDDQREVIESAFEKLEKFSPRPVQSVKLTITHDAGRFSADAVLHLKHNEFRGKGEDREPEYAVNELIESLRKQLTKFKGKVSGRQKGEEGGLGRAMIDDGVPVAGEVPVATEGFVLRDLDVSGAMEAFTAGDEPFLVFRNIDSTQVGVIYRRADGELGHMEARSE